MQTTILLSKYPGEPFIDLLGALPTAEQPETPAPAPARRPTYYSLHVLDTGNVAMFRWDPIAFNGWEQSAPTLAETVQIAFLNVPSDATFLPEIPAECPVREAFGLWVLR